MLNDYALLEIDINNEKVYTIDKHLEFCGIQEPQSYCWDIFHGKNELGYGE